MRLLLCTTQLSGEETGAATLLLKICTKMIALLEARCCLWQPDQEGHRKAAA